MAGAKISATFEINPEMGDMLERVVARYELPDASKALRVLLDYAATDGDWDEIFGTVRCRRCG